VCVCVCVCVYRHKAEVSAYAVVSSLCLVYFSSPATLRLPSTTLTIPSQPTHTGRESVDQWSRVPTYSGRTDSTHRCCYECYQRSQFTEVNAEPSFLPGNNCLCQFAVPPSHPVPTKPMWARSLCIEFRFFHRFWRFSISKNNGQASLIALKNPNGGSRHLVFLETKWYKRGFLLEGASLHQRTKLDEDSSIRGVVTHFDEVEDGCCHPWILVRCMLFSVDVICYFVLSYKMWEN